MEFSEFSDHIKFGNYSILEDILSEQILVKDFVEDNIVRAIEVHIYQHFSMKFQLSFCQFLHRKNNYEKVIELNPDLDSCKENYSIAMLRIHGLWELGQVSLYFSELKDLIELLLINKSYGALAEVLNQAEDQAKTKEFYRLAWIQFNLETNNIAAVLSELRDLRNRILNDEDRNMGFFKAIYHQLENVQVNDYRLYKEKRYFELLLSLNQETTLMEKELIESLLLCETVSEYLLVGHFVNEFALEHLVVFLKKELKVNSRTFPKKLKDGRIKKLFFNEVKPTLENKEEIDNHADDVEYVALDEDAAQEVQENLSACKVYYFKSEDEKRLLRYLQVVDDPKYYSQEMAITFLELKYYTIANYIIKNLNETSNRYYLQGIVDLKLLDFSGAIMNVNYALENYINDSEEALPFMVIKAVAFKHLGDKENYHKLKKQILAVDSSVNFDAKMWRL